MNYRLSAFADEASQNIAEQVEAMRRNGISLLEIRGVDGENISRISNDKAKEVRRILDGNGMAVWSIGSPVGKKSLNDDFGVQLDAFKRLLENADVLGASRVRLFSFYPVEGESYEDTLKKVVERLNAFSELTPDDISLCHENEKKIFGENIENCLAIHKALPKIRAVFDPANFIQCGVNTLEAWSVLKPYVDYLHIKDALADGTVVPAGQGEGHLHEIVSDYLAGGGSVMTLEPHLKVFSGLSELEAGGETLKAMVNVYRTNDEAFDAAVNALRSVLSDIGGRK